MKIVISEQQLEQLIEQQIPAKVNIVDFCGRKKVVNYQQWYYGIDVENPSGANEGQMMSYVNCYKWDQGTSTFTFYNWACEIPKFTSMNKNEQTQ